MNSYKLRFIYLMHGCVIFKLMETESSKFHKNLNRARERQDTRARWEKLTNEIVLNKQIIIIINSYIAQILCEYDQMRVTNKYDTKET